jgi:trk system potassium uptake protein
MPDAARRQALAVIVLSIGNTAGPSASAHVVLMFVMLAGGVGPTTFATAFVTRESTRLYRYPEERPIIG